MERRGPQPREPGQLGPTGRLVRVLRLRRRPIGLWRRVTDRQPRAAGAPGGAGQRRDSAGPLAHEPGGGRLLQSRELLRRLAAPGDARAPERLCRVQLLGLPRHAVLHGLRPKRCGRRRREPDPESGRPRLAAARLPLGRLRPVHPIPVPGSTRRPLSDGGRRSRKQTAQGPDRHRRSLPRGAPVRLLRGRRAALGLGAGRGLAGDDRLRAAGEPQPAAAPADRLPVGLRLAALLLLARHLDAEPRRPSRRNGLDPAAGRRGLRRAGPLPRLLPDDRARAQSPGAAAEPSQRGRLHPHVQRVARDREAHADRGARRRLPAQAGVPPRRRPPRGLRGPGARAGLLLLDAPRQRPRQGRQPQPRADADPWRPGRDLRRRSRAGAGLPAQDGRILRGRECRAGPVRPALLQPRPLRAQPEPAGPDRSRADLLLPRDPARQRLLELGLLLRLVRRAAPLRDRVDRGLQGADGDRGRPHRPGAARAGLALGLPRAAARGRARHRELRGPRGAAHALGARHGADPEAGLPALQEGLEPGATAQLLERDAALLLRHPAPGDDRRAARSSCCSGSIPSGRTSWPSSRTSCRTSS